MESKNKKTIIVIILGLVVVFLVGILIYANFFAKNDSGADNKEDENKTNPPSNDIYKYDGDTNEDAGKENYIADVDGNRTNNSQKMKEAHTNGNLTISDFNVTQKKEQGGNALIVFQLKNSSSEDLRYAVLKLKFYSKENEVLSELDLNTGVVVPANQTVTIRTVIRERAIDAYDYSFEINENSNIGGAGGRDETA